VCLSVYSTPVLFTQAVLPRCQTLQSHRHRASHIPTGYDSLVLTLVRPETYELKTGQQRLEGTSKYGTRVKASYPE